MQNVSDKAATNISPRLMAEVWDRMAQVYPQQWVAYGLVGEPTFKTWLDAVQEFAPNQLWAGLQALINDGGEHPPNLIKFLRFCRAQKTSYSTGCGLVDPIPQVLPRPRPRRSVMMVELAKQKALFGKPLVRVKQNQAAVEDWTREDAVALKRLVESWDRNTGLAGLCELLDDYEFSSGSLNKHIGMAPGTRCVGHVMRAEGWRR